MIFLILNIEFSKKKLMIYPGFASNVQRLCFLLVNWKMKDFQTCMNLTYPHSLTLCPRLKLLLTLWTCLILVIMILMNMPQNIDSRYFTLPELSSLQLSSTDLPILHTNIRSLSLHHDELVSLSAHTNLNILM